MPIIASNFKTNHTRKSTSLFVEKLNEYLKSNEALDEIYIFPTSTSLDSFELNHKLLLVHKMHIILKMDLLQVKLA